MNFMIQKILPVIDFQGLVYEGDVIRSTDSFQETGNGSKF